jgi:ribokinase
LTVTGRVIVVGSVNIDLVVAGERLPSAGETVTGGRFARYHGGKGGNQAVAAARLGARTTFVGAVGDDPFGEEARAALEAEGIDLAGLTTLPGEATGVAVILVDAAGENLISVAGGANLALTPAAVVAALARITPTEGDVILVGHEIPTATAREALAIGRREGATTILNPAPAGGIDRGTFQLADILTPNRGELAQLVSDESRRIGRRTVGTERPDRAARSLLETNAEGSGVGRAVVVTLGAAGAMVVEGAGEPIDAPAPRVVSVDTVGAGDTLNGALAAGIADGAGFHDAVRRAVMAASYSTTRTGAREGMPTPAELETFAEG